MTTETERTEDKLHGKAVPAKSFIVVWDTGEPRIKPSHWAVGYTAAYCETPEGALKVAMADTLKRIDAVRSEWLKLSKLMAEMAADELERSDELIAAVSVTRTPDMDGTKMTVPDNAVTIGASKYDEQVDHGGFEDH